MLMPGLVRSGVNVWWIPLAYNGYQVSGPILSNAISSPLLAIFLLWWLSSSLRLKLCTGPECSRVFGKLFLCFSQTRPARVVEPWLNDNWTLPFTFQSWHSWVPRWGHIYLGLNWKSIYFHRTHGDIFSPTDTEILDISTSGSVWDT